MAKFTTGTQEKITFWKTEKNVNGELSEIRIILNLKIRKKLDFQIWKTKKRIF